MTEKKFPEPQAFEEGHCPDIPMALVDSSQIACVGHCAKTNTLAVKFKHGAGHVYHYPDVSVETHTQLMAAKSKGNFFKERIRPLAFKKYSAPKGDGTHHPSSPAKP